MCVVKAAASIVSAFFWDWSLDLNVAIGVGRWEGQYSPANVVMRIKPGALLVCLSSRMFFTFLHVLKWKMRMQQRSHVLAGEEFNLSSGKC